MVLQIEFRVSAASSRTISRIALLAILQTIALPTELPRREPHFTRKLASESNVRVSSSRPLCRAKSNGLLSLSHEGPKPLLKQGPEQPWSSPSVVRHRKTAPL